MNLVVDGKPIKAVAQITKQAFVYTFDRTNGKPVWPIEERPVGKSDVPGEITSPTQPFPTKPPAFDRQGFVDDDLIDFTPALHAEAVEGTKVFRKGPISTPGSLADAADGTSGTLVLPSFTGGANWEGRRSIPRRACCTSARTHSRRRRAAPQPDFWNSRTSRAAARRYRS